MKVLFFVLVSYEVDFAPVGNCAFIKLVSEDIICEQVKLTIEYRYERN